MVKEESFAKAVEEIRKNSTKKNFDQSVDLIINLKNFDVRREAFNLFVKVPHKIKENKIAGFFEKKSKVIDSIVKEEFVKYKDKKEVRKLVKKYDIFIANPRLMPAIATTFGRYLGPVGKMPNPQLSLVLNEEEVSIKATIEKVNSTARIRVKEPSIKILIGKESLKDGELVDNIAIVYSKVVEALPKGIDNVKNVKIKFTMNKPVKVAL